MTKRVIDSLAERADQFREQAEEAEKIGQLTDDTVKTMKQIGNIRLLQPKAHGGLEVHPREFAETVMATAALDPSAGWINGVVGVHPYQLAYADPRVAAEIWADDVDTWVASPYAPRAWPYPPTAATSSPVAGSSARAPITATGSSWAPWSATPTANR